MAEASLDQVAFLITWPITDGWLVLFLGVTDVGLSICESVVLSVCRNQFLARTLLQKVLFAPGKDQNVAQQFLCCTTCFTVKGQGSKIVFFCHNSTADSSMCFK